MIRQNRKNKEFDSKATTLLAAGRLTDEEIERIASARHMMSSVWARIEAEKAANAAEPTAAPPVTFIFGWRTAFAVAAILIVAVASMAVFMRSGKKSPVVAQAPEQKFVNSPSVTQTTVTEPVDFPSTNAPQLEPPRIERAAYRPEPQRAVYRVKETKRNTLPPPPPLEFYTLPAVQATADAVRDARIVRVELPRASLVALGANIPLEGEKQLVRADLLVGPDGVPRAIRLAD